MFNLWVLSLSIFAGIFLSGVQTAEENVLLGKFELTSDPKSENHIKYLVAMGYNDAGQEARCAWNAFELCKNGDKWTYKLTFTNGREPIEREFEMGKEYEEEILDGRKARTTITLEGSNKLIRTIPTNQDADFMKDCQQYCWIHTGNPLYRIIYAGSIQDRCCLAYAQTSALIQQ